MNTDILIAIIAGLGGMFGWGTADFIARYTIKTTGPNKSLFWIQGLGIIPLLIFYAFYSNKTGHWVLNNIEIWQILIFGVFEAIGYSLFYKSLEVGKISIMSPVFASYSVFSIFIFMFVFGESLNTTRLLSLFVVTAGMLVSTFKLKKGEWSFSKINGLPYALGAMVIFSIWFPFWDQFTSNKDAILMVLFLRCVAASFIFIIQKAQKEKLSLDMKNKSTLKMLILGAIFDAAAYISFTIGFQYSQNGSIITVLSATFSIPSLIFARMILKERITTIQYIGVCLMIVGIIAIITA